MDFSPLPHCSPIWSPVMLLLLTTSMAGASHAGIPTPEWSRLSAGADGDPVASMLNNDFVSVAGQVHLSDIDDQGNVVWVGASDNRGGKQILLYKVDPNGGRLWINRFQASDDHAT